MDTTAVRRREPDESTLPAGALTLDRKSTRLNSSHSQISYAVFCLKKNKLKWSYGVSTMPENNQERGGTTPEDFKRVVEELVLMIGRVAFLRNDLHWQRSPYIAEL